MWLTCAHRRGQAAGHGLNPQVLRGIRWDRWIAVKGKDGSTWIGLACQFGQREQGTTATPPAGHGEDWPQPAALLKPDDLCPGAVGVTPVPINPSGQVGNGWLLEEDAHWDGHTEALFESRDNGYTLQRMGSEIDEILIETDVWQPQLRRPDARDDLLGRRSRSFLGR
jgi:hypothetical protein